MVAVVLAVISLDPASTSRAGYFADAEALVEATARSLLRAGCQHGRTGGRTGAGAPEISYQEQEQESKRAAARSEAKATDAGATTAVHRAHGGQKHPQGDGGALQGLEEKHAHLQVVVPVGAGPMLRLDLGREAMVELGQSTTLFPMLEQGRAQWN